MMDEAAGGKIIKELQLMEASGMISSQLLISFVFSK